MNFTRQNAIDFISCANDQIQESKQRLENLDSLLGDGDLGLTMTKGFLAAYEFISSSDEADIGKLVMKTGMAFSKAVPSTMGTLMASALMKAGKSAVGNSELNSEQFCEFIKAICTGVMERGHCEPNSCTIVDALYPAAQSVENSAGEDIKTIAIKAYEAANLGMESTKDMEPTTGKALYHKADAVGVEDPGSVVGMLLFKGLSESLK